MEVSGDSYRSLLHSRIPKSTDMPACPDNWTVHLLVFLTSTPTVPRLEVVLHRDPFQLVPNEFVLCYSCAAIMPHQLAG